MRVDRGSLKEIAPMKTLGVCESAWYQKIPISLKNLCRLKICPVQMAWMIRKKAS